MTYIAKETVIIHILGQNIEKNWIDYVKIESLLAVASDYNTAAVSLMQKY